MNHTDDKIKTNANQTGSRTGPPEEPDRRMSPIGTAADRIKKIRQRKPLRFF